MVARKTKANVEALDPDGQSVRIDAEGFLAVILQHEIDHLDGKLFLDRMSDLSTLAQLEEWYAWWGGKRPVDPAATNPIGISGIDHVGLAVDDVEKARAWYVELFGMREVSRAENFVSLRVNEQFVFLLSRQTPSTPTALAHVAFRVTREEFEKALQGLATRGISIDEEPKRKGSGRSVYFKDPWGNQLELHHP